MLEVNYMTCREEILSFVHRLVSRKGQNIFSLKEVVDGMRASGTQYKESTIRTHITSRMCANAPDHHAVTYKDFQRVGKGIYRLRDQ